MNRYGEYPDGLPDEWEVLGTDADEHPTRLLISTNEGDGEYQYLVGEPQGRGSVITDENSWSFEDKKWARLCFGVSLQNSLGNAMFSRIWPNSIPENIAIAGPRYIAAFLGVTYRRLGDELTHKSPRKAVAKRMNISEQTVSNYWNEVRWEPETK